MHWWIDATRSVLRVRVILLLAVTFLNDFGSCLSLLVLNLNRLGLHALLLWNLRNWLFRLGQEGKIFVNLYWTTVIARGESMCVRAVVCEGLFSSGLDCISWLGRSHLLLAWNLDVNRITEFFLASVLKVRIVGELPTSNRWHLWVLGADRVLMILSVWKEALYITRSGSSGDLAVLAEVSSCLLISCADNSAYDWLRNVLLLVDGWQQRWLFQLLQIRWPPGASSSLHVSWDNARSVGLDTLVDWRVGDHKVWAIRCSHLISFLVFSPGMSSCASNWLILWSTFVVALCDKVLQNL